MRTRNELSKGTRKNMSRYKSTTKVETDLGKIEYNRLTSIDEHSDIATNKKQQITFLCIYFASFS